MDNITFIADSREQQPYSFEQWPVNVVHAGLPAGDYSIMAFEDRAAIERKELNDLVACLMGDNRTRFARELARLRSYELAAVVIEANLQDLARGRYQSQMKPKSAMQSITAFFIRYQVPFLFCGDRRGSEYMTFSLLSKYLYEIQKRYEQARKVGAAGRTGLNER